MMRQEQPATIPFIGTGGAPGRALEGLYVPGGDDRPGALIAPPHPLYGGSIANPVVTEMALRCGKLDMASLRFNWRGVGASAGETSGELEASLEDYAAALSFLEDSVAPPLVACGYSWGAVAAHRAIEGNASVRKLALVAPPAAMLERERLEAFAGELLIVVGEADALADPTALTSIAEGLPRTQLVTLPGVDHFFGAGTHELGVAFETWLRG
jgi:hypothetical protein